MTYAPWNGMPLARSTCPRMAPVLAAKPGAGGDGEASPEKLYASAMASFRSEDYRQAVLEFRELVDRFPQHPLASNSQYWIGEVSYRQRDFRQALVEAGFVEGRNLRIEYRWAEGHYDRLPSLVSPEVSEGETARRLQGISVLRR